MSEKIDPLESSLASHAVLTRPKTLREAGFAMVEALESLEAWDDEFGSRSITEAVWKARDHLRAALAVHQVT
jgi:hypothetical protein